LKTPATAEKALQLDPLLAEAHDALEWVYARDAQWEQSEKSFRSAIELEPSRSRTRIGFALSLLLPLGRTEEAVGQLRIAEKTDPLSPEVQAILAYSLIAAARFTEAETHCKKMPANHWQKPSCRVRAALGQERIEEAIRILEARYSDRLTDEFAGVLGYTYARAGRRQEAEKIAAVAPRPIDRAVVFAGLGDKDRAFEALDRAIPLGPLRVGRDLNWPEFASLRRIRDSKR
jgi:tetratricopeptide (TPR) repeat protein